ncbi:bifunctional PIG-L family deacetylase/class I SAM-dependent methyltransferase [Agreia sp. VKM Ac-1783]|uniref:bifunctional PIG-L family deacetylase/class I SAM-dependent methyltransferase n=1 Tax=Agreia sp. VKM Ac-1783 TaxID=1938889 RepID=UPI000A2AD745|nr:bifunctional PIG-L family deacetylase/class I SAM-dependent methyltransferase [Agreia sp. VKM Ac-1783]SMQ71955.1 N-acetylglucosaminyl deacetylase, LmbE family [Agreia sp. VKM Ac-1783]
MTFDHRDAGTTNAAWLASERWSKARPLDLDGVDLLVVVAAHPDDETLGAGGLMATAHAAGLPVVVIVATAGERSHPESKTVTPERLSAVRRGEVVAAIDVLAPGTAVHLLGLPDGELRQNIDSLTRAIGAVIADHAGALVASPWRGDGHPDHTAVGDAAAAAVEAAAARHAEYPIWGWHWQRPESPEWPWERVRTAPLGVEARAAKAAALELHRSQTEPLSAEPGDEAIVSSSFAAHFGRDFETFFVTDETAAELSGESLEQGYFDTFYEGRTDPWGFETRWYEERKRALTLAALPRRRFGSALEIGCSIGVLTAELADRVDDVLATDIAQAPLDSARRRLAGRSEVRFERRALPQEWPDGSFDLIVVSEVGYYLAPDSLDDLVSRAVASLNDGGIVVACHWRHPVSDYPMRGDDVHEAFRRSAGLERIGGYDDDDFLLEVFGQPGAVSVAAAEGLV